MDGLPELRPIEEQRLGSVESPDDGFSRLSAATVDSDGNVYALDGLARQIRVFDPAGNLIRRIGSSGGGPGEFENAPQFGVKGDTLWTYDFPPGRITYFDRAGNVLATGLTSGIAVPARAGTGYVTPVDMNEQGLLVGWFTRIAYSRDSPPTTSGVAAVPRVTFDVNGAVVDTIGLLSSPPPRMVPPENYDRGRYERVMVGGRRLTVPDPPSELPQWLPLVDGHIVVDVPYADNAEQGEIRLLKIDLRGDTQFHRVLTYRPQPYTEELLDRAASRQMPVFVNGQRVEAEVDDAARNVIRSKMKFPPYQLPTRTAWLANDGGIWLQRTTPDSASSWIVLSPTGDPIGELQLPTQSRPLWSDGNVLWASVPDDMDVPWLVRYRLERGSSN